MNKLGVLFIHGIVEKSEQFNDFIKISGDIPYLNIVLDGHGQTVKEFALSSMDKWKQNAEDAFLKLCESCEKVLIVGHSMGTLLALDLSEKYNDKIAELFLLAIPFKMRVNFYGVKIALKTMLNMDGDEAVQFSKQALAISAGKNPFMFFKCLPRYFELFGEAKKQRNRINDLKNSAIVIQSDEDEFISPKTNKYLNNEMITYYNLKAHHANYPKETRQKILQLFKTEIDKFI